MISLLFIKMSFLYLILLCLSWLVIAWPLHYILWKNLLPRQLQENLFLSYVLSFYFYASCLYLVARFFSIPFFYLHTLGFVIVWLIFLYIQNGREVAWHKLVVSSATLIGGALLLHWFTTHSSIHIWGEKLMDMSMMQNFLSNPLRQQDPWLVGRPLHYYYGGYVLWGIWGHIAKLDYHYAYLVMVSGSFLLYCSVLWAMVTSYVRSYRRQISFFITLLWLTNISLFFTTNLTTQSFWQMSRVFQSSSFFMEFPWWSFVMQDLHPHFLALPLLLMFLWLLLESRGAEWQESFILGGLLVLLLLVNSWDFIFGWVIALFYYGGTNRRRWYVLFMWAILSVVIMLVSGILSGHGIAFGMQHEHLKILNGIVKHQFFYLLPLGLLLLISEQRTRLVIIYFSIVILMTLFYFMDPLNSLFKFGQGLTLLGMLIFVRHNSFTRWFLPVYLLFTSYSIFLFSQALQRSEFTRFHPLFDHRHQQLAEQVRARCRDKDCFLLEWPGKSYDYSRLQVSALAGMATYIGQSQHLLTRNNKVIWSEIRERRANLSKVLSPKSREVGICMEYDIGHISLTKLRDCVFIK